MIGRHVIGDEKAVGVERRADNLARVEIINGIVNGQRLERIQQSENQGKSNQPERMGNARG